MSRRIYSAAIWYCDLPTAKYLPKNIDRGIVIEGHRHADIIRTLLNLTGKRSVLPEVGEYVQGFVTNDNHFVDRSAAMTIARLANQLIAETSFDELYSEDIY